MQGGRPGCVIVTWHGANDGAVLCRLLPVLLPARPGEGCAATEGDELGLRGLSE